MGQDHAALLVYGIIWGIGDNEMPGWPKRVQEMLEDKAAQLGLGYWANEDSAISLLLSPQVEAAYAAGRISYVEREAQREAAQIEAFGVVLEISRFRAGDYGGGCFVAHEKGRKALSDWGAPWLADDLIAEGGRPEVTEALRKLAELLPGASGPGWYVGCACY